MHGLPGVAAKDPRQHAERGDGSDLHGISRLGLTAVDEVIDIVESLHGRFLVRDTSGGITGHLDVCMLWPPPKNRTVEIASGPAANSVFGQAFTPPVPTAQ